MFNASFASPPQMSNADANMYSLDGMGGASFDTNDNSNPTFDPADFLNEEYMASPMPTNAQLSSFGSPGVFQSKAPEQSPRPQFQPRSAVSSASPESSAQDSSSDSSGRRKRKSPSESSPAATFGSYPSQHGNTWPDTGLEIARGKRRSKHDSPVMKQEDSSMGMLNNTMTQSFNIKSAGNSPPGMMGLQSTPNWTMGTPRSLADDFASMPVRTRSPATFHFGAGSRDNTPPSAVAFNDSANNTPFMMMRDSPDTDGLSFPGRTPMNMVDGFSMFSPPAIQTTTNMATVRPGDIGRLPIRLHVSPLGHKSRVETQIPIKLTIDPLPPHIKRLHLPTETIAKAKFLAKETPPSPDTLELSAMLVCTSAMDKPEHKAHAFQIAREGSHLKRGTNPRRSSTGEAKKTNEIDPNDPDSPMNGGPVRICDNCVSRERKRAGRKKAKKQEDEERWHEFEHDRIIMFNTQEYLDFHPPTPAKEPQFIENVSFSSEAQQVDAPMRIVCYCRHQQEKVGFQVIFTIKDWQGRIVAQVVTQSILITDDHKTHAHTVSATTGLAVAESTQINVPNFGSAAPAVQHTGLPGRAYHSSTNLAGLGSQNYWNNLSNNLAQGQRSTTSMTPRNLSRPASPSGHIGPKKKRKGSSGQHKIPADLMMTRSDLESTSLQPVTSAPQALSLVSPNTVNFDFDAASAGFGQLSAQSTFNTSPPTPDAVLAPSISRERGENYFFSAPNSAHPSRAASPTSFGRANMGMYQPSSQAQTPANNAAFASVQYNGAGDSQPIPNIFKVRPERGSTAGNIEVVILGKNFHRNLEVMFGDNIATTTTFWNADTLVCLLPPSLTPGPVPVTFVSTSRQGYTPPQVSSSPMFTYVDDTRQQLFELAIQLQCAAQLGPSADHIQFAQTILSSAPSAPFSSNQGGGYSGNVMSTDKTEDLIMAIINKVDLIDSPYRPYYDHKRGGGATMLSLASRLGYEKLVAGLLIRGADFDTADVGGFTPLMYAAFHGHAAIVRRLILRGADPSVRNLRGNTAAELARSPEVRHYVRHRRHYRSVSVGSPMSRSRANSATSTRSLWGPPSSGASSTMYSTEDESALDSSDESENEVDVLAPMPQSALASRRQSLAALRSRRGSEIAVNTAPLIPSVVAAAANGETATASTIAVFSALRDQLTAQINALQQNLPSMQLHNFSELLQDQNYIGAGALQLSRRFSSLVPTRRSGSPAQSDSSTTRASSSQGAADPPPPYHEACPDGADNDFDTKPPELFAETVSAPTPAIAFASSSRTSFHDSMLRPRPLASGTVTIGKTSPTAEEAAELRRLREQKMRGVGQDRKLWILWFPILIMLISWYLLGMTVPNLPSSWNAKAFAEGQPFAMVRNLAETIPKALIGIRDQAQARLEAAA